MIDADPVAGRNYPKTWVQFQDWFASEDACASYLEKLRWPGGFCCPACGVRDAPVRASRRRLVCRSCTHQCSVTAGTIFDKTRTPLRVWFAAAWQITSQKHGVSALGLQRVLGLSSYQTAWAMLHRFRRAMVRLQREKLAGTVEVDEAYLPLSRGPGVKVKRVSSKAHNNSHLVVIAVAVEVHDPKGFGRIRIHRVQGPTIDALIPFVRENVMPGATIRTDGSAIYGPLKHDGFGHEPFVQLGTDIPAHVSLPGVHRVISLLKRWLLGTHQGAVDPKHVDYYLDEFAFRFNRRSSRSRGMLFYRLLQQSAATTPATYANIRDNDHPSRAEPRITHLVELNG
ncbi:MAG: IS1595 family transposase [Hydrogenophaga sp.]|uniref:IS1595 family transposase n=1 Tax=Hydrogenophaga sp. TaxID=1904254 RepID=UPI002724B948|nr:IS1595 family transposase [Hydrogenophaga sp.]MDO9147964.1 IS1595 family transposase [Hydrogenophaga sp.]MDO9604320.1 IS1595 family transposase [Hydrogenophaga sp.]MDP2165765.1 IS1595 family transposase [Hydrogenophaga sp.]MDP3474587.1 IS1595 family transposase [Hydrogenophaga sp.]